MKHVPTFYEFIREQKINEISSQRIGDAYVNASKKLGGSNGMMGAYPNLAKSVGQDGKKIYIGISNYNESRGTINIVKVIRESSTAPVNSGNAGAIDYCIRLYEDCDDQDTGNLEDAIAGRKFKAYDIKVNMGNRNKPTVNWERPYSFDLSNIANSSCFKQILDEIYKDCSKQGLGADINDFKSACIKALNTQDEVIIPNNFSVGKSIKNYFNR